MPCLLLAVHLLRSLAFVTKSFSTILWNIEFWQTEVMDKERKHMFHSFLHKKAMKQLHNFSFGIIHSLIHFKIAHQQILPVTVKEQDFKNFREIHSPQGASWMFKRKNAKNYLQLSLYVFKTSSICSQQGECAPQSLYQINKWCLRDVQKRFRFRTVVSPGSGPLLEQVCIASINT